MLEQLGSYTILEQLATSIKQHFPGTSVSGTRNKYHHADVEIYRRNLDLMVYLGRYYGFKVAIFLQPIMGIDDKILTEEEKAVESKIDNLELRHLFYRDGRESFKELKAKHVDSNPDVCIEDLSHAFREIKYTVYEDSGHLRVTGNKVIAREIINSLQACHFY